MALTATQKKLLLREGLGKAEPDAIRKHADRIHKRADESQNSQLWETAEALREAAYDAETPDEQPAAPAAKSSPAASPKAGTRKRAPKPKRTATHRVFARAGRRAQRQLASAGGSVVSLLWSIVIFTVLLVFAYLVLTGSDRAVSLLGQAQSAFQSFIYPKAMSADRAATAAAAAAPAPAKRGAVRPVPAIAVRRTAVPAVAKVRV